jgi:hypothetical protein
MTTSKVLIWAIMQASTPLNCMSKLLRNITRKFPMKVGKDGLVTAESKLCVSVVAPENIWRKFNVDRAKSF